MKQDPDSKPFAITTDAHWRDQGRYCQPAFTLELLTWKVVTPPSTQSYFSRLPPGHDWSMAASHEIFRVMYMDLPAFHEAIYVEIDDKGGSLYQVTGSLKEGFTYETKRCNKPETSRRFYRKYLQGTVAQHELDRVDQICQTVRIPRLEYRYGIRVDQDCRTWVRDALKQLTDDKILRTVQSTSNQSQK